MRENTLKESIDIMKAEAKIKTYKELAEMIDINEVTFRQRLNRDNIRFADVVALIDSLGYEILFRKK
ncbi:hypothetical protein [Brevibacillus laterosporus]|uniref:Uncharacterized protein n=1 Tax=Brevibacillus laterosporus TaxID=1465 RepID=A0AAP3GD14_BRELA|nr:hypothetical protein [Brevibacillus laterosporus]MCR8982275.1 hypothetical protein [Brevibacillus laterosporus]MCZ0809430.1 hypothetical protein [Brevibacillus laterosporus]MCZ0827855.1 hypothetical protein [Brevibacillus laterosporus]MCZ0851795.1 hypothetical protein [Brevibacillus laterosporus]